MLLRKCDDSSFRPDSVPYLIQLTPKSQGDEGREKEKGEKKDDRKEEWEGGMEGV